MRTKNDRRTGWRSGYWAFATIVVGLGIIAFAWQLLLLGLALLVLGPFRDRRLVFWPAIAAVVVFGLVSFATPTLCRESTRTIVRDTQATESTSRVCDEGARAWWAGAAPLASAVATGSVVWLILRERTSGE
jgi:hypothetical protein